MWYIKEVVAAVSRYNVHKLLINFMAPFTNADTWSDEQRWAVVHLNNNVTV